MKVSVEELKSYQQQTLEITFKEVLPDVDAVKPVLGKLSLTLDSSGVRLRGQIKTLLKLGCHRCLRTYFQSLTVDIDERFVRHPADSLRGDRELNKDDFVEPIPADGMLDIDDVVYQAVTLATPTYCLCGDECPGTPLREGSQAIDAVKPDHSGGGLPIDPRWQNLKTLFPNEETG